MVRDRLPQRRHQRLRYLQRKLVVGGASSLVTFRERHRLSELAFVVMLELAPGAPRRGL